MNKPTGFDETPVSNDFTPVELGGHVAKINAVIEGKSKSGKDMLTVILDLAESDSQPGYFEKLWRSNDCPKNDDGTAKWPNQGTQYVMVYDNEGKTNRSFKAFLTSYLDSQGIARDKANYDKLFEVPAFGKQFVGKKIGVVFGEVEEEYNGKVSTRRKIRWFCDANKATEQKIPDRKELQTSQPIATTWTGATADNAPEIPFE